MKKNYNKNYRINFSFSYFIFQDTKLILLLLLTLINNKVNIKRPSNYILNYLKGIGIKFFILYNNINKFNKKEFIFTKKI